MPSLFSAIGIAVALLPAGGCSTPAPSDPASGDRRSAGEKYEECMMQMRGDVFAERTCEQYATSAERRRAVQRDP
jgi:hypothetical protein